MDFGLGEMDFSMDGFAAMDEPDGVEERRYAMLRATPPPTVEYERAVDFCRAMRPEPGLSRFAFVSGNFVLGDILEAWSDMGVRYKSLTVQTLSMSHDNVDSLRNVCDACPGLERLRLVLSSYFYANERHAYGVVPYMYTQLDYEGGPLFEAAFCRSHQKVMSFETERGARVVVHGAANLRSNRCIEHVCIEADDGLYRFVEGFADRLVEVYGTNRQNRNVGGEQTWQSVRAAAAGAADGPEAATAATAAAAGRAERQSRAARIKRTTTIGSPDGTRSRPGE